MEEKKSGVSYLVHAAMQYMFENIDERGREKISHELHTSFPALKPTHYDKNGTGYYTAEQLAIAFDVSTQEIEEKISALSAAGFVIKNNKPKNLKRSQW